MKTGWRTVLGFGDENITFARVHERFRSRMTSLSLEHSEMHELGVALEDARVELGDVAPTNELTSKTQTS